MAYFLPANTVSHFEYPGKSTTAMLEMGYLDKTALPKRRFQMNTRKSGSLSSAQ